MTHKSHCKFEKLSAFSYPPGIYDYYLIHKKNVRRNERENLIIKIYSLVISCNKWGLVKATIWASWKVDDEDRLAWANQAARVGKREVKSRWKSVQTDFSIFRRWCGSKIRRIFSLHPRHLSFSSAFYLVLIKKVNPLKQHLCSSPVSFAFSSAWWTSSRP